jgi:hypothetical protein
MYAERKSWMSVYGFSRQIIHARPLKSSDFRSPMVRNQQFIGSSRQKRTSAPRESSEQWQDPTSLARRIVEHLGLPFECWPIGFRHRRRQDHSDKSRLFEPLFDLQQNVSAALDVPAVKPDAEIPIANTLRLKATRQLFDPFLVGPGVTEENIFHISSREKE